MPKNIVICCDGTRNEFKKRISNVVKLYIALDKTKPKEQIVFYDPGVGTLDYKLLGMAAGVGITQNIKDAYKYLMDYYEEGDRIYLFGFSRGAYTVRLLSGLIDMCGILKKGNDNNIDYAIKKIYYENDPDLGKAYKLTYSHDCDVYFIGVWDTVKAVNPVARVAKFHDKNPRAKFCYQALALDEKRWAYKPKIWNENSKKNNQTIEQVWFSGVHSDIGGSYIESGLSDITLEWMLDNCRKVDKSCQLLIRDELLYRLDIRLISEARINWDEAIKYEDILPLILTLELMGLKLTDGPGLIVNDVKMLHNSMLGWNRLLYPKPIKRKLPKGAKIHHTVFDLMLLEKNEFIYEKGKIEKFFRKVHKYTIEKFFKKVWTNNYYIPGAVPDKRISVITPFDKDDFRQKTSNRKQWLKSVKISSPQPKKI